MNTGGRACTGEVFTTDEPGNLSVALINFPYIICDTHLLTTVDIKLMAINFFENIFSSNGRKRMRKIKLKRTLFGNAM